MSDRQTRALLRIYPPAWRDRYGDELSSVIHEARASGAGSSLSISIDVLSAGIVERMRSVGLVGTGLTPEERTTSGVLRVLWAWIIFVLGGIGVAKAAEYWANAVPSASRKLPSTAYETLVIASLIGSVAVVGGLALTSRTLITFLRQGGWPKVRRGVLRAAVLTLVTAVALVAVSGWAHQLDHAQRNGSDSLYSAAILAWILLFVSCLVAWTIAAVSTARLLGLKRPVLALETFASFAVVGTMIVMTIATAIWWAAVARSAPWYLAGTTQGAHGSILPLNLVVSGIFMLAGTGLASSGAVRAMRNLRDVGPVPKLR